MNDREIVSAIRARLADRLGSDRYEVWFGRGTQFELQSNVLRVGVPNQFFQDWLRCHFRGDLEAVSAEVSGMALAIEFRIAENDGADRNGHTHEKKLTVAKDSAAAAPSTPQTATPQPSPSEPVKPHAAQAAASRDNAEPPTNHRRRHCLQSYVVGECNRLAHETCQVVVRDPGKYSPLLIHGPTGVGKTHLLEGIVSGYRRVRPRAAAVYLSAEQFTTQFLESLHASGLPNFRRKVRGLELIAIDDVQFFANKRATLVELLHTVDTLIREGKQLVLSADRSPTALRSLGPELTARLSGGMICRVEPPEFGTRLGIVRQLAARLHTQVPEEVAHYMASHLTSQTRELLGALHRLQATSQAQRRPITLALAQEALAELIDHQARLVKLPDIEKAVCEVFGLSQDSLQSTRKSQSVSHPRMLAMWLARKYTRSAFSEIGQFFGGRSHSTVISAQKKVDTWLAQGSTMQFDQRSFSLEETIRRVEEQLRAG